MQDSSGFSVILPNPNRITKPKQSATSLVALFLCWCSPSRACSCKGWSGTKKSRCVSRGTLLRLWWWPAEEGKTERSDVIPTKHKTSPSDNFSLLFPFKILPARLSDYPPLPTSKRRSLERRLCSSSLAMPFHLSDKGASSKKIHNFAEDHGETDVLKRESGERPELCPQRYVL